MAIRLTNKDRDTDSRNCLIQRLLIGNYHAFTLFPRDKKHGFALKHKVHTWTRCARSSMWCGGWKFDNDRFWVSDSIFWSQLILLLVKLTEEVSKLHSHALMKEFVISKIFHKNVVIALIAEKCLICHIG